MSSDTLSSERLTLLSLPVEIRLNIFKYLVSTRLNKCALEDGYSKYNLHLNFLRTNRQIRDEGTEVLRRENVFIQLDTPWREAAEHVKVEGRVPLLAMNKTASRFKHITLSARIEISATANQESHKSILTLDDLEAFCKTWFYADLSHLGMNNHFHLILKLSNPRIRSRYSERYLKKELPTSLQQRLLLPFGIIKDLHSFELKGDYNPGIVEELKKAMAVPYESVEQCLETSTELKEKGNIALKEQRYREALCHYQKAFEAIHIVVEGRRRQIYADGYFEKILTTGQYKGEYGVSERFKMRIVLVANTIQAYLKLEEYEEARFWGERSIKIMGDNLQGALDHPHPQFPARLSWGKLLFRTALACKELGDTDKHTEYCRLAASWLPNDPIVQKERAACAPRLL